MLLFVDPVASVGNVQDVVNADRLISPEEVHPMLWMTDYLIL